MLGTGYFLKITKINSQQEKPSILIAKINFVPVKHKTLPIRNKENSCKNFMPHSNILTLWCGGCEGCGSFYLNYLLSLSKTA